MIHVLQLTDIHLFSRKQGKLLGLKTRETCDAVLRMVAEETQTIDLIIITGDLSQDGSAASYQYLAEKLKIFKYPIYWLPGNHDILPTMQQVFSTTHLSPEKQVEIDNWGMLFLDSLDPGKVPGYLTSIELNKLDQFLKNSKQEHLLVALHHQPIAVGSAWLDGVGLRNAAHFLQIIEQSSQLRVVLFGHIHQAFEKDYAGIKFIGTPSTSIQFLPNCAEFSLDKLAPGYRHLNLYPDGTINTWTRRLEDFHSEIDFSAKGY